MNQVDLITRESVANRDDIISDACDIVRITEKRYTCSYYTLKNIETDEKTMITSPNTYENITSVDEVLRVLIMTLSCCSPSPHLTNESNVMLKLETEIGEPFTKLMKDIYPRFFDKDFKAPKNLINMAINRVNEILSVDFHPPEESDRLHVIWKHKYVQEARAQHISTKADSDISYVFHIFVIASPYESKSDSNRLSVVKNKTSDCKRFVEGIDYDYFCGKLGKEEHYIEFRKSNTTITFTGNPLLVSRKIVNEVGAAIGKDITESMSPIVQL